jgi:hypothetical protein
MIADPNHLPDESSPHPLEQEYSGDGSAPLTWSRQQPRADEHDILADFFLGPMPAADTSPKRTEIPDTRAGCDKPESTRRRPLIEAAILGNMPPQPKSWLKQYLGSRYRQDGQSVAILCWMNGEVTLSVLERPGSLPPRINQANLIRAVRSIAGQVDRLVLCTDSLPDAELLNPEIVDEVTLLTSADEPSLLAAARRVGTLAKADPLADRPLARPASLSISLVVVGVPKTKADDFVSQLKHFENSAGVQIKLSCCCSRLGGAFGWHDTWQGQTKLPIHDVLLALWQPVDQVRAETEWTEPTHNTCPDSRGDHAEPAFAQGIPNPAVSSPFQGTSVPLVDDLPDALIDPLPPSELTPRRAWRPVSSHAQSAGEPVKASARRPAPAPATTPSTPSSPAVPVLEPLKDVQPSVHSAAATPHGADQPRTPGQSPKEPDTRDVEPAECPNTPDLAVCLGLHPLHVRCPHIPSVQLATDERGRLHVLGTGPDGGGLEALRSVSQWASANLPLLAQIVGTRVDVRQSPVQHLFTSEPSALWHMFDSSIRFHYIRRVPPSPTVGFITEDLN